MNVPYVQVFTDRLSYEAFIAGVHIAENVELLHESCGGKMRGAEGGRRVLVDGGAFSLKALHEYTALRGGSTVGLRRGSQGCFVIELVGMFEGGFYKFLRGKGAFRYDIGEEKGIDVNEETVG